MKIEDPRLHEGIQVFPKKRKEGIQVYITNENN